MTAASTVPKLQGKKDQKKETMKQNQKFNEMHEKLEEIIDDIENNKIDKAAIIAFARRFPLGLNISDKDSGETILHRLLHARVYDRDLYKTLLDIGASPCIPDNDGFTAALLAADYGIDPACKIFPLLLADCNVYYEHHEAGRPDMWMVALMGIDHKGGNPKAVTALLQYGTKIESPESVAEPCHLIIKNDYPRAKETVEAFLRNFDKKRNWESRRSIVPGRTVIYDKEMMDVEKLNNNRSYFYNVRELAKDGAIQTLYNTSLFPPKLNKSPITRRPWKSDSRYLKSYDDMTLETLMNGIKELVKKP